MVLRILMLMCGMYEEEESQRQTIDIKASHCSTDQDQSVGSCLY